MFVYGDCILHARFYTPVSNGVAEITKSSNLKGCPWSSVYVVYVPIPCHISLEKIYFLSALWSMKHSHKLHKMQWCRISLYTTPVMCTRHDTNAHNPRGWPSPFLWVDPKFVSRVTYCREYRNLHICFHTCPPWKSNLQLWRCECHALPTEPH